MCPGNTATSLMESSRSPFPPKNLRTRGLIHRSFDVVELVHRLCLARFELRGVPDLDIVEDARDNDFFVQIRVLAEEAWNHDSALAVDRAGHGPRCVESSESLRIGIEFRCLTQPLFELGPFGGGIQSEMILLNHQHRWTVPSAYELATEDSRNAESAFGVDGVIMSPAKHRSILASFSNRIRILMNALISRSPGLPLPDLNSEVSRRLT
jgi:hypothetical protein